MSNIFEGKHDKNRYKAIFLIGAPASGKTEFYKYALAHKDMKHLDSDRVMMFLINKHGGNPKDTRNYTKWQQNVRDKLDAMSKNYKEGGLGLVIDGTGKNLKQTLKLKKDVERHGYKTAVVYLKTPLNKALKKAEKRERGVDVEYIKDTYRDLSKNVAVYKEKFSTFIEINDIKEYREAERKINRWLRS